MLVLADDHCAPVLEWHVRAPQQGFSVEMATPADHDWTRAVLAAIDRADAAPLAAVSISSVHWADGAQLDMLQIAQAAKRALTQRLADGLSGLPIAVRPERFRTPHIFSIAFPHGIPLGPADALARKNVFGAVRLGRLRLAPHIYNNAQDIDRAIAALRGVLG